MVTPTALSELRSPLFHWSAHREDSPLASLFESIDQLVVAPLRSAGDEAVWGERLEACRSTWWGLRIAVGQAAAQEGLLEPLLEAGASAATLPAPSQPAEPARGAFAYAMRLLSWVGGEALSAAVHKRRLDPDLLRVIAEELAVIELCWLTLLVEDDLHPGVAEAAAWEAYSRARSIRGQLLAAGFVDEPPLEVHERAAERARALVARLSTGWTEDERDGFYEGRLPRTPELP